MRPGLEKALQASDPVRSALAKALESGGFANSERMQRFLRYAVEQVLEGKAEDLKEYSIGVEVFDRPPNYDPRVDSIVRVEARRLRSKLKHYYSGEGKAETIQFSFPAGSYVPVIESNEAAVDIPAPPVTVPSDARAAIAVLPFTSLSAEAEDRIFADGLTDELIHALSRLDQLRVVARTSVFRYQGSPQDARTVGRELGVANLVEGSIRRAGKRVRVTAQLIDVSNGYELWSEQYDRELTDIFAIQEDLASSICRVLRVRLSTVAIQIVPMDAYQFYLEGLFYSSRLTPQNLRRGIDSFTRALVIEPNFAAAHAGLAGCYAQLMLFGVQRPSELAPLARAAIQEALSLDKQLVAALVWKGYIQAAYDWDWIGAEQSFRSVLELSPSHAEARYWYGALVLAPLNRLEEARTQFMEALRLDPASLVTNAAVGIYFYLHRDYDAALQQFRRTSELDPSFYGGVSLLASAITQLGEFEEAAAVLEAALPKAAQHHRIRAMLGYVLGYAGREAEALDIARQLEREAQQHYVSPFDLALPQIGLAFSERALDFLYLAKEERSAWLSLLNVDPIFDELRDKPRFRKLVELVFAGSTGEEIP